MLKAWSIILIHQIVLQGMFIVKNVVLARKIGKKVRGNNREATVSILFFVFFIAASMVLAVADRPFGEFRILSVSLATVLGSLLLIINLFIAASSLVGLRDSWRVGVLVDQKTELISTGIYRFTRNPYFLAYMIMHAAYTVILQNALLLGLTIVGFILIHRMVLKEEEYLYSVHGAEYLQYKKKVPRYIFR